MTPPRIVVPVEPRADALIGWDRQAAVVALDGDTMGTVWRVRFAAPLRTSPAPLRAAIVARLDDLVAQMSHWDSRSALCRFNAAAAGSEVALPPDFARVIAIGVDVAARSEGAFDPAIGRLVDAWGYGPTSRERVDADEVAAARAVSGWRRLVFDSVRATLRQPGGLALDLSGIAKGYAADAVADLLAAHGFRHALVEIGGECVGRGLKPDGDPWWVDVEAPQGADIAPLRIALHACAVATSGDYVRGAHTIDPRTGVPASGFRSVTVLHASAMLADAWASALTVLDRAAGERLAAREGLAVRWIDTSGSERFSAALAAML